MNTYTVYILRCADGTLYTGITTDLTRRLHEHNADDKKGARYTKARRPVHCVYKQDFSGRSHASKQEHRLKKLSKSAKEALIKSR